jgi:hypothetical protein
MTTRLHDVIKAIPTDLEQDAAEVLEALLARHAKPQPARRLRLDWAGGLSHLKDKYPSGVEAAHAAVDEWADEVDRKYGKR